MLFNSFLSLLAIGVAVADRVVVYSDPVSGNVNEGSLGYAYKQVSATYTATSSRTAVTFLTRHDPRYFYYDDFSFSVSGQINGTINLLANPGFESGSFSPWVLVGQQGLSAAAQVTRSRSHTGVWYVRDGAVGGIDGVSQLVDTIPGQLYDFSFWIAADAGRPALGQVVLSSFDPPTISLPGTSDSGDSNSDRITNTITVSGGAPAGQAITIFLGDGTQVGTTTTGLDNTYSFRVNTAGFPAGNLVFTATTTAGGFESALSDPLTVQYVPPGTYTMNAAVSGRTSTEVSITGSTPSQMNRFLTYTVMDGSNQPITGTAASDGSGQFAFSFTSTSAGSVRIDGFDIAGNPMQTSVVYSAFVAPSTTSSSSAPPLTSAPLSLVNSSTSTQMTNQTTAQTLSRPSTVLNITATAVPFMSSASQPGIGSIAPIPASPTTVTSTVTTTVHGPTQTVVALRLFVNGLPILDAEDKSLTAGSGRVTVIVSIGKVLIAVSVDSVGPAIAAIISGGPSLDGLAPTIVSLIVVMIPAISVSSSSNVTTTTTVQGFMTVVTGIAGVAPGVDTIPATTVVTTQTVLVTSLGSSVPTVLPVVGIAGGIGAVAPDSQDSGTYVAAGPVLTSVVSRPSPSSATPTTSEPAKTTIAVPASLGGAERCSSAMFAGILALASLLLIYK